MRKDLQMLGTETSGGLLCLRGQVKLGKSMFVLAYIFGSLHSSPMEQSNLVDSWMQISCKKHLFLAPGKKHLADSE